MEEDKKLFEDMVNKFLEGISVTINDNPSVTMEDRNNLTVVCQKVDGVRDKISSATDLSSSFIKDSKSQVIKELNEVCYKLSNLSIINEIQKYVHSIQDDDDYSYFDNDDDDVDVDVDDDVDDDDDDDDSDDGEIHAHLLKNNIVTQEIKYYDQTLQFLQTLMKPVEKGSNLDYYILIRASSSIEFVCKDLSDESSSVWSEAFNFMINKFRTQVESQLNYICNNVSNFTIKEACSQHLVGFKMLPSQILDSSLDYTHGKRMSSQSEMTTTEKKSKSCSGEGESGSGGCKSQIDIPENHEAKDELGDIADYHHDHNKCIEEQEERSFPRVIRIGKWDPDYKGQGISLLDPSALHNYSVDELDLANMSEFHLEDELDGLANTIYGIPKFHPEDELDHAYE